MTATTQVKVGNRVRLVYTDDPYTRLTPGTEGTVAFIDDRGTVHVDWEGGSNLGMVPGVDRFEVVA